jgi:hypothetical protein
MTRTSLTALAVIGMTSMSAAAMHEPPPAELPAPSLAASVSRANANYQTHAPPAERGAYLVKIMGCNDCHTPWKMTPSGPEPDMSRQLSGHPQEFAITDRPQLSEPWGWSAVGTNTAFAGPWGVSFTANLTPDKETGLGKWTADTFLAAIRNGRHEGQGRPLLPPMPWPMYRNATDEDLRAIFAYLQSIPAVRNRVPLPLDPPAAH